MPSATTPLPAPAPHARRDDIDARGCRVSGANALAIDHFETALAAFQSWRGGAEAPLARALQAAPGFVMAHALEAYLLLCSRDVRRIHQAREVFTNATRRMARPTERRERLHLAAIAAVLADDYPSAKSLLGSILQLEPRDVLALQVAHSLDYLTGDVAQLRDRVARVLPAWRDALPGHHAVLAMHAFGLVECGETDAAERAALAALALDPLDARAHHAMAHVFEMRGTPDDGVRWMERHAKAWRSTAVATHCAWHMALFHLNAGRPDQALAMYDRHARVDPRVVGTPEFADLIDASALLWRAQLRGGPVGAARWQALAEAWEPHIGDLYCSFSDVHAMLAFIGAQRWDLARRLERDLAAAQLLASRHGASTRAFGLPAARALMAFGRGRHTLAITLLASLPPAERHLGGSHAQRDVLHLTLQQAVECVRRPVVRRSGVLSGAGAVAAPAVAS